MKFSLKFIFASLILITTTTLGANARAETGNTTGNITVSCDCPKPNCGKCETETGTDFYTEKCGPGLSRVKSCKRRQCQPVPDQQMCLAELRGTSVTSTPRSPANASADSTAASENQTAAEVILAAGRAHLERGERSQEIVKGMKVFAGDRIVTKEDGRVRIRFPELSEIFVSPLSMVVVAEALIEKRAGPAKRTILLDLVKGRVRSRVQGRYDDGESKFAVKTKAAVAGVRGTDFTVTFEPGEEQWKTIVQTISGEVSFDAPGAGAHSGVSARTWAAYIVPAPSSNISPIEFDALMARGFMTPVFKMSDEDVRDLERETDLSFDSSMNGRQGPSWASKTSRGSRAPAGVNASLCRSPMGSFNQCSWTCEGNPKGATKCRSDLSGVRCVRRLCRASGEWAEPTALPAKEGAVSCEGVRPIVGDCGGYW